MSQPHANPVLDEMTKLSELESQIVRRFISRERAAHPRLAAPGLGDRVADRVASFGGSWTFIFLALAAILAWMIVNAVMGRPFDPYPYILLNLGLSCTAALQAPIIMMSQ